MKKLILVLVCFAGVSLHAQNIGGAITQPGSTGGGSPTGAASGSLCGNYPGPCVALKTTDTLGGVTFSTVSGPVCFTLGVPRACGWVDITPLVSGTPTSSNFPSGSGVWSTITFPQTVSVAGAASTPMLLFNGTWFTSGSASTNTPQLFLNGGATAPTDFSTSGEAFGINSPSGYGGNLMSAWLNGSRVYKLGNQGDITARGFTQNDNAISIHDSIAIFNVGPITWGSGGNYLSPDTSISRLAAGAVGVGPGTTGTFSSTLQAGVTATDPGCTTTSHIGKQWFDITTTTTVYKVCLNVAGTLTWVTK